MISFSIGTLALAIAVAVTRPALSGIRIGDLDWWMWIGGLCGVVYLTFNMVLMRHLGAAIAVVIPVVGQVFGGLIIDAGAFVGAPHHPLTVARTLGAALVVCGAAATVIRRGHFPRSNDAAQRKSPLLIAILVTLGIVAGGLSALQTTVNGALGAQINSPLVAALVSFAVGTAALGLINVGRVAQRSHSQSAEATSRPRPRLAEFSGGLLGAAFVFGSALCAPILGTATTVSVILLGQLASGMVIDHAGLLGAQRRHATIMRVAGCFIVLAGVALVRLVG